ncbi:hypothetical protein AB6A40_007951 [Gnathostoma spinigerum]|uniref:2-(3-amino-3-carboxypropyl)histidine synthase subunit 2 n=1 Tax=Gnathostoma spinigerum TaxID=75299 RepID=A0ABD6EX37_9BILA
MGRAIPTDMSNLPNVTVIFVGEETSAFLPLWLMTHPNCCSVLHFSPSNNKSVFSSSSAAKSLKKRFYLVEKLKDADKVGLVVGSLGVHGYREGIDRIRRLCKQAGKRVYVFSVGKVNVPKLSNFASDIDVFILLSCPYGVLLNSKEYYRPVLSMFEAEVALNPAHPWHANQPWTSQFCDFLNAPIGERTGDEVDVSLITGRIRALKSADDLDEVGEKAVYFDQRSWTGVGRHSPKDDTLLRSDIIQGRGGTASAYTTELAMEKDP